MTSCPEPSPSNDDHQPTAAQQAPWRLSQSIKVYGTLSAWQSTPMLVASSTVYGTFCTVHQVIVQSAMVRLLEGANTLLTSARRYFVRETRRQPGNSTTRSVFSPTS